MKGKNKLEEILVRVEKIILKAENMEQEYTDKLSEIHPMYRESALNLIHYLAFRSFNLGELQQHLRYLGLPDLSNIEGHVMTSLQIIRTIIHKLLGNNEISPSGKAISIKQNEKLLRKNTIRLFGSKSNQRRTRILVTLPKEAADKYQMVFRLMQKGMNSARINCAHDDETTWLAMIENVKKASKSINRKCKIMMDLGGPKARTGAMQPGPQVVHIKPEVDSIGQVIQPVLVWIAPPQVPPKGNKAGAIIPISETFVEKIRRGNTLWFTDTRGKNCQIEIVRKKGKGMWGHCYDSAFLVPGTEIVLQTVKESGKEKNYVGELIPAEQFITLFVGDTLILHESATEGEPARVDLQDGRILPAHISCTLPEVFQYVKVGEPVFLNDGKIEGIIAKTDGKQMEITITNASRKGSRLRADKGINFPETNLPISGLTEKDKVDLEFVAQHADAVNLSFINSAADVEILQRELKKHNQSIGIVLKIETRKGFINLPEILLQAMQSYPVGIMVARGDLAIETGWENFATIQEEIMRMGEAGHLPVIWATQVLETLAKKGVPTRSEITDAALAQRAECVMLNKGRYIEKALQTLNDILVKMQGQQKKKKTMLPQLKNSQGLTLINAESEPLPLES